MKWSAIYPGSFDPITKGHLDIIQRSGDIFNKTLVGVGKNADKKYLFTFPERVHLIQGAISKELYDTMDIEIKPYSGLLVNFAKEEGVATILRGIRNSEDLTGEQMLHLVGESQKLWIDTAFLLTKADKMHVSSSTSKAILKEQGNINDYVTLNVKHALEARMMGQYLFGVTGTIGAGKSYITDQFVALGEKYHIPVHNIDLDKVGHKILGEYTQPGYVELRQKLAWIFGAEILDAEGFVDRKVLWAIVFPDPAKRKLLDTTLHDFLQMAIWKEVANKKGIILLNGALLAEAGSMPLANNQTVVVDVAPEVQKQRLADRGHTPEQIETRIQSQFSTEAKLEKIHQEIEKAEYGKILSIENNGNNEQEIDQLFNQMVAQVDIFWELRVKSVLAQMGLADKYNDIYMRLKSFHDTPERLHHDWSHIVACLDELYEVKSFFSERVFLNLFFAILLHDVVYSATAKAGENEAQSAVFADELLKKLDFSQSRIEKIHALILSTANHQGTDIQEQWMGDIDCAVLGMGWERYRRYLQAIRFEYGYFSDKQYREGRLAFLKEMQERRIFQTPYFYEKYEDQAKLNIEKEIEMLEGV